MCSIKEEIHWTINILKEKNPRLKDYDYTLSGYYFITICTKEKEHYFGKIANGIMQYNEIGQNVTIYYNPQNWHEAYIAGDYLEILGKDMKKWDNIR